MLEVYAATAGFPADERFGLTAQLRRAAASIPTNLAEGCGRNGNPELARFTTYSAGSASEVEYLLMLARDLEFLKADRFDELQAEITEIKKMLAAFHRSLTRVR